MRQIEENRKFKNYFNIVIIASIFLTVICVIEWTLGCFENSLDWLPAWYNTVYRVSLKVNPCLLLAFIVSFIALLCLKKINFTDYKKQIILFAAAAGFWVLSLFYVVVVIAKILGPVMNNF